MTKKNIEFKARVESIEPYEERLKELQPVFIGTDHQVDTYFQVEHGRLKLREGNIENALIHYERDNTAAAKRSQVRIYTHEPGKGLKEILLLHLQPKVIVDKLRKIYFIGNAKFHFDKVESLGEFVEVEIIDDTGNRPTNEMQAECAKYWQLLGIQDSQLVSHSYSDLLLEKT